MDLCRVNKVEMLSNLPEFEQDKIREHLYEVFERVKPSLQLKHGLSDCDDIYSANSYYKGLFNKRVLNEKHLWLPDSSYVDSYKIFVTFGDEAAVKLVVDEVINSDLFRNGSIQFKISYLDVLERFAINYPVPLYKSLIKLDKFWIKNFIFSKRPNHIRGVELNCVLGLRNLVAYFMLNYEKLGFSSLEELLKEYYKNYPKNFNSIERQNEWKATDLDLSLFVKKWVLPFENKEIEEVLYVGLNPNLRFFKINLDYIVEKVCNNIQRVNILNDFESFLKSAVLTSSSWSDDVPFYQVVPVPFASEKDSTFTFAASLKLDLSEEDFVKYTNFLVIFYIYYRLEFAQYRNKMLPTSVLLSDAYWKIKSKKIHNILTDKLNDVSSLDVDNDSDDTNGDFKL